MRNHIVAAFLVLSSIAGGATAGPVKAALARVDNGHATLTLAVTTKSRDAVEVVVPIELPIGMTATGLTVAMGDAAPLQAFAFEAGSGQHTYDGIVAMVKDPALLEYDGPGKAMLRVFPVRRGESATVVIELSATSLVQANDLVHIDAKLSLLAAPNLRDPSEWVPGPMYARVEVAPTVDDARLLRY